MALVDDLENVIRVCEEREQTPLPSGLRHRLARSMAAAVEKALVVGWLKSDEITDPTASNPSIVRAAERAAHDVSV